MFWKCLSSVLSWPTNICDLSERFSEHFSECLKILSGFYCTVGQAYRTGTKRCVSVQGLWEPDWCFRQLRYCFSSNWTMGPLLYALQSKSVVGITIKCSNQRERERWQPRFKEERDCSSKCVIYLGGVINQTNQIVCLWSRTNEIACFVSDFWEVAW